MTVGVFMPNVRGTPNAQMIIDALPRLSLDFAGAVALIILNETRISYTSFLPLFPRYGGSAIKGLKEAREPNGEVPFRLIQICDFAHRDRDGMHRTFTPGESASASRIAP